MKLCIDIEKRLGSVSFLMKADVSGERIGIFGASGSGKSTLVRMIAGLLQPDRGEIRIDGECIFSSRDNIAIAPERRRMAIVFQQALLFPHLGVRANLLYGYRRCRPAHRNILPEAIIDILELQPLLQRSVEHLSGGEKQRVALGRAVLASPRLLLMDEPLSALDDTLRFQIIPYLKRVSEEFRIPYLFISHSVPEMQLMADRVLLLSNGSITEELTSEWLARRSMARSPNGYHNLLRLADPICTNGLFEYPWGSGRLLVSDGRHQGESLFELSSRDIILFRKHPEAISARNLLECTVAEIFDSESRKGIVLSSNGRTMVAEIVHAAASELSITQGMTIFAAVKASAFRRLG